MEKSFFEVDWDYKLSVNEVSRFFESDLFYYNSIELLPYGSSSVAVKIRIEYPLGEMSKYLSLEERVIISEGADYHSTEYLQYLELTQSALDELREKMQKLEDKLIPLLEKFKKGYNK